MHVTLQFRASGTVTTEDHTDKKKCCVLVSPVFGMKEAFSFFLFRNWQSFVCSNEKVVFFINLQK